MADIKELKPKSFRIDEETAEKFKAISTELGNNQQQTLSKLIETYEFQKGKAVLTQKKDEIETFEKYVTILTRMYMASLENNENVTQTVQAEFDALLVSKDQTILGLQEQVSALKNEQQMLKTQALEAKRQMDDSLKLIAQLEGKLKEQEDASLRAIEDKDQLIEALTESCNSHKKEAENYEKATLERSVIATKQMQLQNDFKVLQERYASQVTKLDHEKLLHERAMLQKEQEFTKQLQEMEHARKQEIDMYQRRYLELLQELQKKPEEAQKSEEKSKEITK